MQDSHTLCSTFSHPKLHFPSAHHDFPSLSRPRNLNAHVHFPSLSTKTITPIPSPPVPPKITQTPSISPPPNSPHSEFQEKMLYLDSIGVDFFSLINDHPPIVSASLNDIKSTVDLITSLDFAAAEFRRIVSMCPEILTSRASDILPVFTFLLREAKVNGSDLKRVISRRPRLLVSAVKTRLRPTLYFLQSMGIAESASALSPPPMTWQSHLADRTWGSKSRFGILPLVMILEAVAPIIPCAAWSLNHSRVLLRREGGMIGIVSA